MQTISGCWKLWNVILILLGSSLCWTVLLLYALAADSMRLLVSALTSFRFFLAEDEHVGKSNPRVLSVHCCWQVESWSWCRTKMKLLSVWHETCETNTLLCWMNDTFLWHCIQTKPKSHIINWKENACSHKGSRAPKGVCLIISCVANGKIHKASHLLKQAL